MTFEPKRYKGAWSIPLTGERDINIFTGKQLEDAICRHENCSECGGTGKKKNGQMCVHMISCNCNKCKCITL